MILESHESAVARAPKSWAKWSGTGSRRTASISPCRTLTARAVRCCGVWRTPECGEEIPYVNAHATSTPLGDYNEAEAIAGVFAGCNPYVASTKSMTGHEMWMAGASEVVYSMLMMRHGFIAPNINFTEGDEATSKLNIPVRRVDTEFDCFLSNSFGFGGTNSTLIVKKYK